MIEQRSGLFARLTPARVVGIAALGSIAAKELSQKLFDPDLWWHLRTGRMIVALHGLPTVDPYSYTAHGKPWVVQEWGSELILYGLRRAFGLYGIVFYRAIVLVAVYALFARLLARRMGSGMGMWALFAIAAYAGSPNWTERPNLLSFLLFVVTLDLLDRGGGALKWFVPLCAVWANLHGMVILGIGLVALVATAEGLKVALRWEGADSALARRLGLTALGGLAASMANPEGPLLIVHSLRLVKIVQGFVGEWHSPNFHAPGPILFLGLLVLTIIGLALNPKRPDPTEVALATAFTALALSAARNLAVAGMVLGLVCARALPGAIAAIPRRSRARADVSASSSGVLNAAGLLVALAALAALVGAGFPRANTVEAAVEDTYPVAAIDRLQRAGVRVFAYDGWSGMVIDRAWPAAHVYIDLRWDFYGAELSQSYGAIANAQPDWESRLDAACTTHTLLRPKDPLTQAMIRAPNWTEIRRDRISVIFARRVPAPGCARSPIPSLG